MLQKRPRPVILVLIVFCILLILSVVIYQSFLNPDTLLRNTQKSLFGVRWPEHAASLGARPEDEIIRLLGDPKDKDDSTPDQVFLVYDGFSVLCSYRIAGCLSFGCVYITDPSFELWRGGLRIGSSREDVEQTYKGFERNMESYRDLYWEVEFIYDQDGLVRAIALS